ncbi:magnesium chelatase [Desulfocarbo indianensis]|nr:magnesium chelatase [Desulfocarbo indianensis]
MKLALILNVVSPGLSGVLIRGEKGTGKSTAARALAAILPMIQVAAKCPFQLDPAETGGHTCRDCPRASCRAMVMAGEPPPMEERKVRVVELPVGATEDRVVGSMDLERALKEGEKYFEPGILASAHRGILYVDEVNLLDDHVVDVLLDSAAMGINTVEREGVSFSHPARFTLVGTMNPEEGELRPQLLDRFGLCVQVEGVREAEDRVLVMDRRASFDEDPQTFGSLWMDDSKDITEQISQARELLPKVRIEHELKLRIAEMCLQAGVDGHRADIICLKTAKTLAAWQQRDAVNRKDVERAATLALPHRMRRQPFEQIVQKAAPLGLA